MHSLTTPAAVSHDASSGGQTSAATQAAADQKRQKKPKMSDAEVIAHLSELTATSLLFIMPTVLWRIMCVSVSSDIVFYFVSLRTNCECW